MPCTYFNRFIVGEIISYCFPHRSQIRWMDGERVRKFIGNNDNMKNRCWISQSI